MLRNDKVIESGGMQGAVGYAMRRYSLTMANSSTSISGLRMKSFSTSP